MHYRDQQDIRIIWWSLSKYFHLLFSTMNIGSMALKTDILFYQVFESKDIYIRNWKFIFIFLMERILYIIGLYSSTFTVNL